MKEELDFVERYLEIEQLYGGNYTMELTNHPDGGRDREDPNPVFAGWQRARR